MLQVERIALALDEDESLLRGKAAAVLRIDPGAIAELRVLRRALDAREGVRFVYTLQVRVKNEAQVLRRCRTADPGGTPAQKLVIEIGVEFFHHSRGSFPHVCSVLRNDRFTHKTFGRGKVLTKKQKFFHPSFLDSPVRLC